MSHSTYHQWLCELTSTPTASGCEDRVIAWISRYVKSKRNVAMKADKYGNLVLWRKNVPVSDSPIYITAHMDHPAFAVHEIVDSKTIIAEFRGGVKPEYFPGMAVNLYHGQDKPVKGKVVEIIKDDEKNAEFADYKLIRITFPKAVTACKEDVLTWALPVAMIRKGLLHAPAVDDLGGLAAAIAAFDSLDKCKEDVRLLFTRAEEMAFIGAIAACKAKTIEKKARLVCLETSKSFAESPIGGGPIVRVGDFTSTFHPDLTYRISRIARDMEKEDPSFKWQRKLMPGGTCEASAFGSYGYISTCLCLPLGNYHNMNEQTQKIDSEVISIADFDGLVRLLVAVATGLNNAQQSPGLKPVLEDLFKKRKRLL
jgi:endoglucanase